VVYKGILDFTMSVCIYQGEPPLHLVHPLVKSKIIAGIKKFFPQVIVKGSPE
jgi:hypothetical protein